MDPIITNVMLEWARTPDNIRDMRPYCKQIFDDAAIERAAMNTPYHKISYRPASAKEYIDHLVFDQGYNTYKRAGAYGRLYKTTTLDSGKNVQWEYFQFDKRDKIGKQYAEMVCRRYWEGIEELDLQ